jgi:4-hydroxybenzoate polyprenyltransferase
MSRLVGVLRSTHPGPSVVVTALATVLALGARSTAGAVVLVAAAVLANQFCVGLVNDLVDRHDDRATGRTDKPLASGVVAPGLGLGVAIGCGLLSLALAAVAGPGPLVADAVFLAAGLLYDLAVKRTLLSPLPYLVGFAALPWIATTASRVPHAPAWWATAAAALLGTAAHFANVLPDLADDRRSGVRGLPQRLGRGGSVSVCLVLLGAAALVLWIGLGGLAGLAIAVAGFAIGGVAAVLALRGGGRGVFRAVMALALADAIALALAGPGLS